MTAFASLPTLAFLAPIFEARRVAVRDGVVEFLAAAEHKLELLGSAIRDLDYRETGDLAHELQESFAEVGMPRAQMLATEIAHLAEICHGEELATLHQAMRGCFAAGRRALLVHLRERV